MSLSTTFLISIGLILGLEDLPYLGSLSLYRRALFRQSRVQLKSGSTRIRVASSFAEFLDTLVRLLTMSFSIMFCP